MNSVCRNIRAHILSASHASGHGHIPTSFSIIEAVYAAYSVMRHDPKRPGWPERDLFLLSKGHASLGYYCTLASLGYFPADTVSTFGSFDAIFGCHADRLKVPGVEASTGSLGHGIGLATGMALGLKIAGSPRRVFALVGDGESNEGTVWEAIMVAVDQNLSNLTIIYDNNKSQGRCLQIQNPGVRFAAFGCEVSEVDGHDIDQLVGALKKMPTKPHAIVANTVKGYGCKTLVDDVFSWHRRSPKATEVTQLMEELNAWSV